MSNSVQPARVQPRVAGQDLEQTAGGWIFAVYGLDVLAQEFSPTLNASAAFMAAGRTTVLV
jgi:hypothetical protein